MTEDKLLEVLKKMDFNIVHNEFKSKQTAPYGVYTYQDEFAYADNRTSYTKRNYHIEIYLCYVDENKEIEKKFKENKITYSKTISYIGEQRLFKINYEMEVLKDEWKHNRVRTM